MANQNNLTTGISSAQWTGMEEPWSAENIMDKYRALRAMQQSADNAQAPASPGVISDTRAVQMINMRLSPNTAEGSKSNKFEFLNAHQSGEEVHVFVIADGKPVVFSDGIGLFPSDQLITQLRLIAK